MLPPTPCKPSHLFLMNRKRLDAAPACSARPRRGSHRRAGERQAGHPRQCGAATKSLPESPSLRVTVCVRVSVTRGTRGRERQSPAGKLRTLHLNSVTSVSPCSTARLSTDCSRGQTCALEKGAGLLLSHGSLSPCAYLTL